MPAMNNEWLARALNLASRPSDREDVAMCFDPDDYLLEDGKEADTETAHRLGDSLLVELLLILDARYAIGLNPQC